MAYNREQFKNAIEECIGCAVLEFYKVKLMARNRSAGGVADRVWKIRDRLETGLVVTLLHDTCGFEDPRKAIDEAVIEVKREDERFRRVAKNVILANGKLRRLHTSNSDQDCAEFWALFDAAMEVAFQATGQD